jgi:hypothetical protein
LLEQEKDNMGTAEGLERVLRSKGKGGAVIRLRARNAVNMADLRTTAGIQVSDG